MRLARLGPGFPPVPRLGIATRGNTSLRESDIEYALDRGVRYFNWCGKPDGLSRAIAGLGRQRDDIVLAAQLKARTADEAGRELDRVLRETRRDRLDVGTLYYVESAAEWQAITAPGGPWEVFARRRTDGQLGAIGLTTHQRPLAALCAADRAPDGQPRLDMLMVRYNAAHTGAEQEVFPVAATLGMPVVTFTGLRWRDLLRPTPDDPPGFCPPSAADCYRFCLAHPCVAVTLAAPNGRDELTEDLKLLDDESEPGESWLRAMRAHGRRVHRHAREFW